MPVFRPGIATASDNRPRANWQGLSFPPASPPQKTNSGVVSILVQWGPQVQFKVWPLNFHELEHRTQTSWAKKQIVGAANYREWTGEEDEMRTLRGRVFPYRLGGMTELEILDGYRRGGIPNMMTDSGGRRLGWYVMEHMEKQHTAPSAEGIGQVITFEATFARVPVPEADDFFSQVWKAGSGTPTQQQGPIDIMKKFGRLGLT